jgi:tellurite resistance protein
MSVARTIADMLAKSTDRWAKQRKAEIRDANARLRRADRMSRRKRPLNQTEAAAQVLRSAYMTASANGTLPANPRQIYYAARPEMLRLTEKRSINSKYFTQTLLTEYMRRRPEATANWNIAWDDRGHFSEPHTRVEIGLGTLAVRSYIRGNRDLLIRNAAISVADIKTKGPDGRYGAVLFLEKEGFTQILEATRIAERYDLAIMSTKGMSVTAARTLVEDLCGRRKLKLLVLHDFDLAGFSIKQTLVTSNRRHSFRHAINCIDLGLRLTDVEEMELPAESFAYTDSRHALAERLRINGATDEEIRFLLDGERVELNAMTSDVFVAFVERKLVDHGIAKVVPPETTLTEAFTAFRRGAAAQAALRAEMARLNAEPVEVPSDLDAKVRAHLEDNPEETWDAALKAIAGLEDEEERGNDNDDE